MGLFDWLKNKGDDLSSVGPMGFDYSYTQDPEYLSQMPSCPRCGATMIFTMNLSTWECPACGTEADLEPNGFGGYSLSRGYNPNDDNGVIRDYEDYYPDARQSDEMPECCKACGGPWPDCETSCKLFDD